MGSQVHTEERCDRHLSTTVQRQRTRCQIQDITRQQGHRFTTRKNVATVATWAMETTPANPTLTFVKSKDAQPLEKLASNVENLVI